MGIRMSGINSGLDTDSIVQALMSAQNYKKTKVQNKQTTLEWKQEAWKDLNTKLYNFYKTSLSKIRTQGTFKTKAATSSDTSKVTATANSSATEGAYRIKVKSIASAQYVTSGKVGVTEKDGKEVAVTSKTKLMDITKGGSISFAEGTQVQFETTKGGYSTLTIDKNTTVNDFLSAAKNAGLNATFDEKQQRFFISSSTSGADQNFSIKTVQLTPQQVRRIDELKGSVGYEYLSASDKTAVSKIFDQLQRGTATQADVEDKLNDYANKAAKAAANSFYKEVYTEDEKSKYFNADGEFIDETAKVKARADLMASGMSEAKVNNMKDADLKKQTNNLITKNVNKELAEHKDEIANVVDGGLAGNSTIDSLKWADAPAIIQNGEVSRKADLDNKISNFVSEMGPLVVPSPAPNAMSVLGLSEVTGSAITEADADPNGMVVVEASDAAIEFNGATLTSSNSTLEINGLTLNILSETVGDEVTISVTKDASAVYDTIKDFITEYNSILSELNTKYNAASSRGYDPLTDDQKEAMTDDEIEKWEAKIKDSLLRRDDTVSSIISSFRTNMMGSITYNGKKYSLGSLGISTSTDYKEGGLLHIKGDEDDDVYGDEENILEKMLTEDPDAVMEVFSGVAGNLYNDLQKKMAGSTLSSALTFYNDKELNKQWSQYRDEVNEWTVKLNALEDRYYSQFTAMEKALASLNSQQSALSGLLG